MNPIPALILLAAPCFLPASAAGVNPPIRVGLDTQALE